MSRSADPPFRRLVAGLAGSLAALVTAVLLPAGPAFAELPDDVPAGDWLACADADAQHCVEQVTVTPDGGEPAVLPELQAWAALSHEGVLTWRIDGWDTTLTEAQDGEVTMVIRTGVWIPRFTSATARDLRVTRTEDGNGNHTLTITGRPVAVAWDLSSEDAVICTAGFSCGGYDSMASAVDSGYRFRGQSRSLDGLDEAVVANADGAYIASGAQATPDFFDAYDDPDNGPALALGVLGNPQLDADGDPVRGGVNLFVPAGYLAAQQTTPEAAVETGFDLVAVSDGSTYSIPASATVLDDGVAVDIPDIAYPAAVSQLALYRRVSQADPAMTAPGAPQDVVATGVTDGVTVSWAAPESDGGSPITGYRVRAFAAVTGGPVLDRCDTDSPETTTCEMGGMTDGDQIWVAPSAVTVLGESGAESRVAVTVGEPVFLPTVPLTLKVVAAKNRLTATWAVPGYDGNAAISRYTVRAYRTATGGTPARANCVALAPTLTCAFTGLTNPERLYLEVSATNKVGTSPYTARVGGAPLTVASAPRSVTAKSAKGRVTATWAASLSNGNTPITRYQADVFTAAKGGSLAVRCTATGSGRACTGAVLKVGRTYYLGVTALNAVGVSPSSARVKIVVKK
jgi:hypothetical protein